MLCRHCVVVVDVCVCGLLLRLMSVAGLHLEPAVCIDSFQALDEDDCGLVSLPGLRFSYEGNCIAA